MNVNFYLQSRAAAALSTAQKASVHAATGLLAARLEDYFAGEGADLSTHFRFGSFTRGTNLPRSMDQRSDIDYMVAFAAADLPPQAYLKRLGAFVEACFGDQPRYPSSRSVVVEIRDMKFDLVPAQPVGDNLYQIPEGPDAWRPADTNAPALSLEAADRAHLGLVTPTIRLLKYWNTLAGYVFESYGLETWAVGLPFRGATDQRGFLFSAIDAMKAKGRGQWQHQEIRRAKEIVRKTRGYDAADMPYSALAEIKKLIPER